MKTKFKPLALLLVLTLTILSACSTTNLEEDTSKAQKEETTLKVKTVLNNVIKHVEKMETTFGGANTAIYMLDSYEVLSSVTDDLKEISSTINKDIITLESMNYSDEESRAYNGLIDSMKAYKNAIDAKVAFYKSKGHEITSSNELSLEGNIYSLFHLTDLSSENDALISDITSTRNDMKQRVEALLESISAAE